jgi:putative methyltransferase (TIGR04325 family)
LHNIGNAICPYQVLNKKEFVGALEALGYRAVDEWEAAEFSCYIPFHPQRGLRTYSGMYLQASAT